MEGDRTGGTVGLQLFQNNNDSMFDAVNSAFPLPDAGKAFETLNQDKLQHSYSWQYDKAPKTEGQEKELADKFMEALGKEVPLEALSRDIRTKPSNSPATIWAATGQ